MVNDIIKLLRTKNISEATLELIRDIIICEMISPKPKRAKRKDKIEYPSWSELELKSKLISVISSYEKEGKSKLYNNHNDMIKIFELFKEYDKTIT